MRKKGVLRKLLAGALSTVMVLGMTSMVATAAPNPAEKGSITVHKYLRGVEGTEHATGNEIADTSNLGTAAEGVGFSLKKVTLPTLGEGETFTQGDVIFGYGEDGRVNVVTFTTNQGTKDGTIDTGFTELTGTTDAAGEIVFGKTDGASSLDQGYYLLEETKGIDGYEKALPSIISIPMTTADGTDFLYDVHVYPKNISNNTNLITKTINENDGTQIVNPNEEFIWTIEAKFHATGKDFDVNTLKSGESYGTFTVTDTLPTGMIYVGTPSVKVGGTTLTLTDDYIIDTAEPSAVKWKLTNAGIDKAIAAGAASMKIEVTTKYSSFATDGVVVGLKNKASSHLVPADTGIVPGTDPEVETSVPKANILVNKTLSDAAQKAGKTAAGIQFVLATKEDVDLSQATTAKADGYVLGADNMPLIATTNAEGKAAFEGLTYNSLTATTLYVIEYKTKDGLQLKQKAIPVVLEADKTVTVENPEYTVSTGEIINYLQTETDPDSPTFQLPLTGGMGTVIFIMVAIVSFAGAAIVIRRAKARKS